MAIIKKHRLWNNFKKYKGVKNNGGYIQFQTSLPNNGDYSWLHKIAKLVKELTKEDFGCELTKLEIINKFSDR